MGGIKWSEEEGEGLEKPLRLVWKRYIGGGGLGEGRDHTDLAVLHWIEISLEGFFYSVLRLEQRV